MTLTRPISFVVIALAAACGTSDSDSSGADGASAAGPKGAGGSAAGAGDGTSAGGVAQGGTGASGGRGANDGSGATGAGAAGRAAGGGTSGAAGKAGSPGVDPCAGKTNAPGRLVDFLWPAKSNTGNDATEGDTVHFHWGDGQAHNVVQVALFEGNDASVGKYADAHWPGELHSGAKTVDGSYDWSAGSFPCGYRPGLYYLVDENNPAGGIAALSYTSKGNPDAEYPGDKGISCDKLSGPRYYGGRYVEYATRSGCTLYEVNNFQTEAHYDWVPPNFGAAQGDLILFRWSGLHNVVQVHDVSKDQPLPGGISSGHRTNCVPGVDYLCANGSPYLGESLIDTKDYRPGVIHLSDQCAYGCASCPEQCDGAAHNVTGTNFETLLSRPVRPAKPVAGACCAIDKSKGQACRVVDLYNDNQGSQFDYNVPVNRGDLVRFRWSGSIRIVQTTANANGSPSKTPHAGGVAMPEAVECVPGPNETCLGGNTDKAQLVFDVDKAIAAGDYEPSPGSGKQFDFYAYGENIDGGSSADSGILLYVDQESPYASNPACP